MIPALLDDLIDTQRDALDAIVEGKLAWSTQVDLIAKGHDKATLGELDALGLVARWRVREEPSRRRRKASNKATVRIKWTLSPIGAAALGLEIIEFYDDGSPIWGREHQVFKRLNVSKSPRSHTLKTLEDFVADDAPGPEEAAEHAEEWAYDAEGRPYTLDGKRVLLEAVAVDPWSGTPLEILRAVVLRERHKPGEEAHPKKPDKKAG